MLHFKLATGLDDIATVMIGWMRKMRHEARLALDEYALSKRAEVDELVRVLYGVLLASNSKGTSSRKLQAIQNSLPKIKISSLSNANDICLILEIIICLS